MKIPSPQTRINIPAAKLFELTGNCQNLAHYLPEQVKDFSATEDSCTFSIENIANVTLTILEKTPFTYIRYKAENDKNIPISLELNYTAVSENETDVQADLEVDIPFFLKPVIEKPLQRFVKELSEKIKKEVEKTGL
ncbi:MAG: hypothetical protein FWD09_02540 [Lentimicrobiaceae bacterium]|nr:hypothetical protein [Lentimicrobiaceae bacterium]